MSYGKVDVLMLCAVASCFMPLLSLCSSFCAAKSKMQYSYIM